MPTLKSTNQHLWSVEISISVSLIVEISMFDRWNLHRYNCKQCICWSWDRQISISNPLKSASASLWLCRSAYSSFESCITKAIANNILHVCACACVLAGQGWVALLTDVGMYVACRGHNRLWAMIVRCICRCVWPHTWTSCDGQLHSWCVAQQHVRYCVCWWCSRSAHVYG